MKRITLIALLLLLGTAEISIAHPGYHIEVKMTDVKDTLVYLAHYYGKPLPTIYKRDSARFNKNGIAVFDSHDTGFIGGIYLMLLSDKKTYFEFLLNDGDNFSITATAAELPMGVKFKNSTENERFLDYVTFLKGYSTKQAAFQDRMKLAKTAADTAAIRKEASSVFPSLISYRRDYVKSHPGTLLSAIFKALEVPEVPEGTHMLADGVTKDTTFAYTYYKAHYWDGFNFQDDRLIHAPIYDAKLEEYMNKLVYPAPDSVEKESDILLAKTKGTKELFKYTLWWITKNVENSKVMGMDEVFVYLVENYYMKGDATWLTSDELTKYLDRAQKIAPNVIGNIAPEVKVPNVFTKQPESLLSGTGKYTILVFYSPDCGHCQKEMPELDSVYKAVLKKKGVKIFTVATEGDEKKITDFLTKDNLTDWTNTWDPDRVGDWRGKYDVYSTPTIYLLDEKKIIRGKRIDHSNIANVIDMLERKEKDKANKAKK